MSEWDAARLASAERVLVLFHAQWCPFSSSLRRAFEDLGPESPIPFADVDLSHPLDARWDEHRIHTVPTVLYLEKGEELERLEAERGVGLTRKALEGFVAYVESLWEDDKPKWAKPRQPTSRRP